MTRIHLIFAVLSLLAALASAASAPTFCKCSCFRNSTIIPLDPQYQPPPGAPAVPGTTTTTSSTAPPSSASPSSLSSLAARAGAGSCMQCTRAFCLSNNLPICRGAKETDVVAMCFQRDSRKDQIIVWVFLLATTGLLGWAGAQRVLQLRADRRSGGIGGSGGGGSPGMRAGGSGIRSPRSPAGYTPLDGNRDDS